MLFSLSARFLPGGCRITRPANAQTAAWSRPSSTIRRSWSSSVAEPPKLPNPLGLLAELTHRCPLGCPYCSNPLALDPRDGELDAAHLGAGVHRSRRHSACCTCICPAASRARGAISSTSRPMRARPGSTPISSPRASASPPAPCATCGRLASTMSRSRSRMPTPCRPIASPAIAARSSASMRSPPKRCGSACRSLSIWWCTAPTSAASATWSIWRSS